MGYHLAIYGDSWVAPRAPVATVLLTSGIAPTYRQQDIHIVVPALVRAHRDPALGPFVPALVVATIRAKHPRDWKPVRGVEVSRASKVNRMRTG